MELKRLVTQFTYRIEPKPEGGFVAHATDPTIPVLEAPTREELQQKIQATIAAGLAKEFPGLKFPAEGEKLKFAFHIEHKPGGGFTIHSGDANTPAIEGASHDDIESPFIEKLTGLIGKHMMPELMQALAQQGNGTDIKVVVNRQTFSTKAGSNTLGLDAAKTFTSGPIQANGAKVGDAEFSNRPGANFGTIDNAPLTPEAGNWKMFRFLLALLLGAALTYFFAHHR
jgi:hypothetical protein